MTQQTNKDLWIDKFYNRMMEEYYLDQYDLYDDDIKRIIGEFYHPDYETKIKELIKQYKEEQKLYKKNGLEQQMVMCGEFIIGLQSLLHNPKDE